MLPHFYYSPAILRYDFGSQHPLRPERLRRTIELLERYGVSSIDPGEGKLSDLLRVHDEEYVDAVLETSDRLSKGDYRANEAERGHLFSNGFGSGDNPPFAGMYEASLAYVASSAKAAEAVRDGASLAFGIGGGLHHALRSRASGFCIFDDPAVACDILLEKFDRVAYIDIDVHHGDGVQWIFYNDPRVLTCSIHEEGRTLFPGTGGVDETGAEYTSFNVPIQARSTGDVWLKAFLETIPRAIEAFKPGAIVLQMGTDTHVLDPLAHIRCLQQDWLGAVKVVGEMGLPLVALGGGGYNLATVPRMWVSACLTLGHVPFEDEVPEDLGKAWRMPSYSDPGPVEPSFGQAHADQIVNWLVSNHIPHLVR
jgi:acetoin utilization protein AcuC